MSLFHKNRLEIKLGEYAVGQATALVDPLLVNRAQDYRRQTAARMIPLEPTDILKRFPAGDYHVSLKVDGEFSLLAFSDGEALLVNPGGTVRVGLPLLKEAADLLKKRGVKNALITGELFFTKAAGKRPRVHDVSRTARQPGSQAELDQLAFAPFDLVEIDGGSPGDLFTEKWNRLTELFKGAKRCVPVESVWLKDAAAIEAQFRKWVEQGAEGAVVRSDAVGLFKLKPRHSIDAVVIGFTEGTDDRRGMVHDLLLAVMRPDGCLHVLGHVGGGFDNDERRAFLSDLKDMAVESDYVEVNDQVAYHMVRPEWVVEVSILDMISQTTRGSTINKMALHWDAAAKRYRIVRRLPLVNLISPQFVRRREDKSVNPSDIRLQQVTDLVEVALADRDARGLNMRPSEVLRREVYTKQLKGQTMVRKLLMWQTNKDQESEDFPAYVIHYTDFSPNRKTPLERDIRVSSSRDQIEELWKELASEAFTKGWNSAGAVAASPPAPSPDVTAVALAEASPAKASGRKAGKKSDPSPSAPAPEVTVEQMSKDDPASPPAKKRASPRKKKEE